MTLVDRIYGYLHNLTQEISEDDDDDNDKGKKEQKEMKKNIKKEVQKSDGSESNFEDLFPAKLKDHRRMSRE